MRERKLSRIPSPPLQLSLSDTLPPPFRVPSTDLSCFSASFVSSALLVLPPAAAFLSGASPSSMSFHCWDSTHTANKYQRFSPESEATASHRKHLPLHYHLEKLPFCFQSERWGYSCFKVSNFYLLSFSQFDEILFSLPFLLVSAISNNILKPVLLSLAVPHSYLQ